MEGHRLPGFIQAIVSEVITYCLLVEEHFGARPRHGVVVLAGGKRVEVENTDELQAEVLEVAARIREHRGRCRKIPVRQPTTGGGFPKPGIRKKFAHAGLKE